jgi:hypothetical protein
MILSPTEVGNRRARPWPAVVINIPKTWIPDGGHATIPKAERRLWNVKDGDGHVGILRILHIGDQTKIN